MSSRTGRVWQFAAHRENLNFAARGADGRSGPSAAISVLHSGRYASGVRIAEGRNARLICRPAVCVEDYAKLSRGGLAEEETKNHPCRVPVRRNGERTRPTAADGGAAATGTALCTVRQVGVILAPSSMLSVLIVGLATGGCATAPSDGVSGSADRARHRRRARRQTRRASRRRGEPLGETAGSSSACAICAYTSRRRRRRVGAAGGVELSVSALWSGAWCRRASS